MNRQFVEQMGPIELVDENVTIVDLDNCLNHTLVQNITVTLNNPQPDGEDQLIVGGEVQSSYQDSFSCDQEVDEDCYILYLRSLTYNNSNPEPGTFMTRRRFTIEVHTSNLLHTILYSYRFFFVFFFVFFFRHLTMLEILSHLK